MKYLLALILFVPCIPREAEVRSLDDMSLDELLQLKVSNGPVRNVMCWTLSAGIRVFSRPIR